MTGFDCGGERPGVGWVVGGKVAERLNGDRSCGDGGAVCLQFGLAGEAVDEAGEGGRLERVEELFERDVVQGGEIGEAEVGP